MIPALPAADSMFEPFFTTKEAGKGTGLGLTTVFGIVQQSGGALCVETAPARGTTFRIYLPLADAPRPLEGEPAEPLAQLRGQETVLLVEDDEPLRRLTATVLRRSGYEVLEAENAGAALLECEQHQGRIHLMLADVVLPRMSGTQLASRLSGVRPGLPVIFMSGYTDRAALEGQLDSGSAAFLRKPFTPEALLRRIRKVLGGPCGSPA